MTNRILTAAFLLVAFLFACPSFAAAKPKERIALRLAYESPEALGCPDAEQLGLMVSAEFGYPVVRPDASALLSVRVQRGLKGLRATLRAPDPVVEGGVWERETETRGTCQELAYDIATLARAGLGPSGWAGLSAPSVLRAPPEVEVGEVVVRPYPRRLFESLAMYVPRGSSALSVSPSSEPAKIGGVPVQAEVSLSAHVLPYGLPGFSVGGGGMIQLRLGLVGVGMDIRGSTMVTRGFGTPEIDGRVSVTTMSFPLCILSQYLDVCGTVGPSVLSLDAPPPLTIKVADGLSWGVGARLAVRYPISKRFTFLGFVDGSFQFWPITIRGVSAEDPTVISNFWQSPTFRVTLGAGLAYSIFEKE